MRWACALFALLFVVASTQAEDRSTAPPDDKTIIIYGKSDGAASGWAIVTLLPVGWTGDCCHYAKAIGVNLVLYKGDWTGEPDRVMVLNVWSTKLATLDAEWKEDQKQYLQRDPAAKVESLSLHNPKMTCRGFIYHGSDHIDDVVIFCDPGKPSGIHLSWSMTVAASDPARQQVLALFQQVVEASFYMKYQPKSGATGKAAPHK